MNKIEELQGKASHAVKVIIATGLVSMALFGATSGVTTQIANAEGVNSTDYPTVALASPQLYAGVTGTPQAVSGAVPDTTNGGGVLGQMGSGDVMASVKFTDMTDHWAHDAVTTAVKKGYVDGYPDGTFQPAKAVTRAEFIKLLVVATTGQQAPEGQDWFDSYVTAAKANKIVKDSDFSDGDYNKEMTRFELARASVRAIGLDTENEKEWMYLATSSGLVQGMDDSGTLGETELTNRAQSVVIIERVLQKMKGGNLEVSVKATAKAELAWHNTNIFSMLPRYFNPKNASAFDLSVARYDSSDGVISTWADSLIVVDMADYSDPNRELVKDMVFQYDQVGEDGRWLTGISPEYHTAPDNSYVLLLNSKFKVTGYNDNMRNFIGPELLGSSFGPDSKRTTWTVRKNSDNPLNPIFSHAQSKVGEWNLAHLLDARPSKWVPGNEYSFSNGMLIPKGDSWVDGGDTELSFVGEMGYAQAIGEKSQVKILPKAQLYFNKATHNSQ